MKGQRVLAVLFAIFMVVGSPAAMVEYGIIDQQTADDLSPIGDARAASGDYTYYAGPDTGNSSEWIYKVHNDNGTRVWRTNSYSGLSNSDSMLATFSDGTVVVGRGSGGVLKLTKDGNTDWDVSTPMSNQISDIEVGPNGDVYAVSDGYTIKLDGADGSELWNTSQGGANLGVDSNGDVFVANDGADHTVYKFDGSDGSQITTGSLSNDGNQLDVNPVDDHVFVWDGDNDIDEFYNNLTKIGKFVDEGSGSNPTGMEINGSGYLFAMDQDDTDVDVYDPDGVDVGGAGTGTRADAMDLAGETGQFVVGEGGPSVTSYETDGTQIWTNSVNIYTSSVASTGGIDATAQNTISGTVKDKDGNGVGSATVKTGGGTSTTTSSDGTYSLDVSPGTYDLTATKTGYTPGTNNNVDANSDNSGVDITMGQKNLTGTVEYCPVINPNCNDPTPLADATVEIYAVDHTQITPDAAQTKKEKAQELIEDAKDPKPPEWDNDLTLPTTGSYGEFSKDEDYVAIHTESDWGLARLDTSPDLSQPIMVLDGGREYVFHIRDVSKNPTIQDGVDEELPGVTRNGSITFEQLGPTGETTHEFTIETDEKYGTQFTIGKRNRFTRTSLPTGFYRVSADGSSFDYIIAVGDPEELANQIQKDLKDKAGTLTDRANDITDKINNNKFTRTTVKTDSNGDFGWAPTSANLKTVGIQVIRADGQVLNKSSVPSNPTPSDLRDAIDSQSYNGSIYIAETEVKDIPANGVTITALKVQSPANQNITDYQDRLDDWLSDMRNETFDKAMSILQDKLDNYSKEELKDTIDSLNNLIDESDQLKEEYKDISNGESPLDDGDLNNTDTERLQEEINRLNQAINRLEEKVESEEPETTIDQDNITVEFPFESDFSEDTVSVIARYSNGTTKVIESDTDGGYWHVDKRPGQGDVVIVEDYPFNDTDPATVSLDTRVADEDGNIGKSTANVLNPSVKEAPEIDSISLSTQYPGTSDTVRVEVNAASDSSFKKITASTTVIAPDGSTISTSGLDNTGFRFTTSGQGRHLIRLYLNDTNGNQYVETLSVVAGKTNIPADPTIRVQEGVVGTYALVGDGLDDGRIDVHSGGSMTVSAIVGSDSKVPTDLHVHVSDSLSATEQEVDVRVLKGSSEKTVSKSTWVYLHYGDIDPPTTVYRESDQPISSGDGTKYGTINYQDNGTMVKTFTGKSGAVSVTMNTDPTRVQRAIHWARVRTLGIPNPFSVVDLGGVVDTLLTAVTFQWGVGQ